MNTTTQKLIGLLNVLDYNNPRLEFYTPTGKYYVIPIAHTYFTERAYGKYPAEIAYIQKNDGSVVVVDWHITCKEVEDYPALFTADGTCVNPCNDTHQCSCVSGWVHRFVEVV